MLVQAGATDVTTYFHLRLAADGTDATGLTITDFDLTYVRTREEPAAKVDATALADQDSAHGDNQAIEVDGTNMPGVYRVDWPDAAFAANAAEVVLTVKVATAFTESLRVQIVGFDPTSVTRGAAGTALPAVAAGGNGGVPTVDGNNRVAGIQGTINTLDGLDTAQDSQHATTQAAVASTDAKVDDIKAKTDQLNFGVTGKVDANITHVNEVAVAGDGSPGTEWNPA